MDNKSLSHTRWKCQYHIVFIPKYRKKVLYGRLRNDAREILSTLCKYKNVEIIAGAVCVDHVHLSVAIPPKLSISNFMGYLKGKSTLMIYDRHPELQSKWDKAFWAGVKMTIVAGVFLILSLILMLTGKTRELMKKCKKLMDYSIFIARVREYGNVLPTMEQAIASAIKECIQRDVLSDILLKHRGEVTGMLLEEYDEQWHIDNEKRWSREEGEMLGVERVNKLIRILAEQGRTEDIIRSANDIEYQKQLFKEFNL